uniref:Uncharacterized protein n=1 Tax=Anguilla anguilla TaxID=7936 RepID=A0A0E9WMY0_ANGAN
MLLVLSDAIAKFSLAHHNMRIDFLEAMFAENRRGSHSHLVSRKEVRPSHSQPQKNACTSHNLELLCSPSHLTHVAGI